MPIRVIPRRDRKLYRLIKAGTIIEYSRQQRLYAAGDAAEWVYVVLEGHIQLALPGVGDARERIAAVAGPGEMFGEEALIPGSPRRYSASTGEVCRIVSMSGTSVFKAFRGSPKTLSVFLEARDRDLAAARSRIGAAGRSTKARLAGVILYLAQRLGELDDDGTVRLHQWFTHRELADLAGAHRSTITTALNEWIYDGILRQEGHELIVANPDLLRALSGW